MTTVTIPRTFGLIFYIRIYGIVIRIYGNVINLDNDILRLLS